MLFLSPVITVYILFLSAVLGMVMGSFSNCMAWRIAHGESVMRGRSHCAVCGHSLSARELIPVLSWVMQGGKCRHCGEKISLRYPLTELLCGAAFVAVVLRYDVSLAAAEFLVLCVLLLAISLVDLESGIIPDSLLVAGILNFIVFSLLAGGDFFAKLLTGVLGGLSVALPLLIVVLIMDKVLKRESMGGGDIKLFFVLGLYFSWLCNIFTLILACIFGIVFALVFSKITTGDAENPKAFPFGPSIAAATFVSILAAEPFVNFYLNLF